MPRGDEMLAEKNSSSVGQEKDVFMADDYIEREMLALLRERLQSMPTQEFVTSIGENLEHVCSGAKYEHLVELARRAAADEKQQALAGSLAKELVLESFELACKASGYNPMSPPENPDLQAVALEATSKPVSEPVVQGQGAVESVAVDNASHN